MGRRLFGYVVDLSGKIENVRIKHYSYALFCEIMLCEPEFRGVGGVREFTSSVVWEESLGKFLEAGRVCRGWIHRIEG